MSDQELSLNVPFIRGDRDNQQPVGSSGAEGLPALAFPDVERIAAVTRSMSQDAAGVPAAIAAAAAPLSMEAVIERSNFLPAWFLDVGARRSAAICQVKASGRNFEGETGSWSGTGFLVSDSILLTNHHVLNSPEVAAGARCVFNFQVDENGKDQPTKGFRINPNRLWITSKVDDLDFTFVWVEGEPGKEFGRVPLDRSSFPIGKGEFANIIQHPAGRPKAVVVQESLIQKIDQLVTHYTSDTEPGSSGSCVFNNEWRPFALHHASRSSDEPGFTHLNEGIRLSAIAAFLEKLSESGGNAGAVEVLSLFRGMDTTMGFFGALGRTAARQRPGVESVVDSYRGEAADIDVAFWNVEWLANRYEEKAGKAADVIAKFNLDIWALEETSPAGTEAVVKSLREKYGLDFGFAHSEPNAPAGKQSTSVIWNKRTVAGQKQRWPEEIEGWLQVRSGDFDDLHLEAVEGKVFDRYPALYRFSAMNRDQSQQPFDFYLVPLHLKAMAEGSKRRRMAARIMAAAVKAMKERFGAKEQDWVIGGDFNAELATGDFNAMIQSGLVPLSARDEQGGAMSYLKSPKSLIDHIFLSADLASTHDEGEYFIVAADKTIPAYVAEVSDHRPVLVRLSLHDAAPTTPPARRPEGAPSWPASLLQALNLPEEPGVVRRGAGVLAAATAEESADRLPSSDLEAKPSDFELRRAIDAYIPLLQASYAFAHGNPNPPMPGFEILARIKSGSNEAIGVFEASGSGQPLTPAQRASLENDFRALNREARLGGEELGLESIPSPDAFGFVVRHQATGAVIVSIRGTQTPEEWVKNFTAIPNPFNEAPEFGAVHLGFESMWRRVRASVEPALRALPGDTRITFLGHSLGGAMAMLGAVDMKRNLGRTNVDVCTFGGPRVGLFVFRRKFNQMFDRCFRVTNQGDIVPHVPPFLLGGWVHAGLEITVNGQLEGPHGLDAYLAGLKRLDGALETAQLIPAAATL